MNMNARKEVEYIAEIVRLKSELKKAQTAIGKEMLYNNKDLLLVANECIQQIGINTDNKARINISSHETMPIQTGITERRYYLTAEIMSVTKI